MTFLLSAVPILLILFLMVGLRWGAERAGGLAYLSALVIAVLFFGAGPELLAYAHARALLLSLDVLLIIWAAFLLFRVADEAGAIRTIGQALPHLTADRGMQALIIGWVFASFLQGVGGFGVPVAVIAPILVGLGFTPLSAVIIPSLGHGWAVTFGSLGSSFAALTATTGLPAELLAPPSALFLGISALLIGGMVAHAAGGWAAVRRLFAPVLALAAVMGTVQYLMAVAGLWNIAAFAGGLAGLLVGFPLARTYGQSIRHPVQSAVELSEVQAVPVAQALVPAGPAGLNLSPAPVAIPMDPPARERPEPQPFNLRSLVIALSAYAVLIAIILIVQFVPGVKTTLSGVVLNLEFEEVRTALGFTTPAGPGRQIVLLRHAGAILAYASVIAFFIYRRAGLYRPGAAGRILNGTLRKVLSSSVSIASMVTMAVIMENAGMTDSLARGLAEGTGAVFPLVSPWIGAMGAFMTGSNTNSNVVLSLLQMRTAELLSYPIATILAAQTAGAGLASVMAPAKVVVGASTAGMAGREGDVMRRMLVYTGILVLLISLLAALGVWVF